MLIRELEEINVWIGTKLLINRKFIGLSKFDDFRREI